MEKPLVSVILPVFNGEKYLADAIDSVLNQDYKPLEVILVDDGSTDHTAQVAAEFGSQVRYVYQPNVGPAAARNRGLKLAKGEFIAFIDADDLWPESKLSAQMRCFEAFSTVEIVQGLILKTQLNYQNSHSVYNVPMDTLFLYTNLGSMVMRKAVFEKIGDFDPSLRFHEDSDFWIRAREAGIKILVQRKLSLIYRIHGANLTTGRDMKTTGFLGILQKSITRRRKLSGFTNYFSRLSYIPGTLQTDSPPTLTKKNRTGDSWPFVSCIVYDLRNTEDATRAMESILLQEYPQTEVLVLGLENELLKSRFEKTFNSIEFMDGSPDLAADLNKAIQASHGELVAFLDGTAEWPPESLKLRTAHLMDHPEDGFVAGRTRQIIFPENTYPADLIDGASIRKSLGDILGTLLVRRSTLEEAGGFSLCHSATGATDWLLRTMDLGIHHKMLPEVCLFRFIRPDSQVPGVGEMKSALLGSVRSSIHRKRVG